MSIMSNKSLPKELLSLVANVAPLLGTALGGSAGTLIGSLIANAFGANPKDPNDIIKRLMSDPEYELKLQTLEMTHEETLKKLSNEHYAIEVQNITSARDYNAKVNDSVVHIIAIGYSGLFAVVFVLAALKIVEVDQSIFINIFSIAMIIINYYFGSSHKVQQPPPSK